MPYWGALGLIYGGGCWLQHNMETEVRAEIHVIAAFQPDGRACSYLLACTPMTASKEHLLLRDAQAQKPKAELWAGREVENHTFLHKTLP